MTMCEQLYNLLREKSQLTNSEIQDELNWDSSKVRKYKHLLKKRGFIAADDEGVVILKEYPAGFDVEASIDFKQAGYRRMYDACMERAEDENTTTPQFIALLQESRLILDRIV